MISFSVCDRLVVVCDRLVVVFFFVNFETKFEYFCIKKCLSAANQTYYT